MKTLLPVLSYLSHYLAFLAFCGLTGLAALAVLARRLDRQPLSMPNLSTALFVHLGTGTGLVVCGLFLLAATGQLHPWALALTAVLGSAASLIVLGGARTDLRGSLGASFGGSGAWIWVVPLLVYGAGLLLGALRLPFAFDELSYHLPYARDYVEAGGLTLNEFRRYPLQSHNFNLLFSLALIISDERLAHLLHGGSTLLIALGLFGTARRYLGLGSALVAILVLFSFDGLRELVPTAYVDLGLALFVTLGAFSLVHWHETGRSSWLFVAAIATGMAMGTKYIGALFAPLFGIWVLMRSRSLPKALSFALVVTLFGVWWYLRSYLISGNPVHPFAADLFGHFLWDARDLADQYGDLDSHAPGSGLLAPLFALFRLAFGERPELSALALPFFATPFVFRRLSGGLRALFLVTLAYYLIWAWFLGPSRYLVSIMPGMSLFSAAVLTIGFESLVAQPKLRGLAAWFDRRRGWLLPVLGVLLLVLAGRETLGVVQKLPTWPWNREAEVAFMTDRYPGYDLIRTANEDPDIDRGPLYLMGLGALTYWYEGRVMGDYFGPARYRQILVTDPESGEQIPNPERMKVLAAGLGLRAVLVEQALFPDLDPQDWSRHFRLIAQTELGSLWLVGGGEAE